MSGEDRRGWLEEMRADLGEEAAARLCAAAGGQRRHVPRTARGGWIAQEAGPEAEIWLVERFGGEEVQVPLLETSRRAERRRRMELLASAEAESANALARRLGIHRRTVQRLRAALRRQAAEEASAEASAGGRADPRQLDLFDPPAK